MNAHIEVPQIVFMGNSTDSRDSNCVVSLCRATWKHNLGAFTHGSAMRRSVSLTILLGKAAMVVAVIAGLSRNGGQRSGESNRQGTSLVPRVEERRRDSSQVRVYQ